MRDAAARGYADYSGRRYFATNCAGFGRDDDIRQTAAIKHGLRLQYTVKFGAARRGGGGGGGGGERATSARAEERDGGGGARQVCYFRLSCALICFRSSLSAPRTPALSLSLSLSLAARGKFRRAKKLTGVSPPASEEFQARGDGVSRAVSGWYVAR